MAYTSPNPRSRDTHWGTNSVYRLYHWGNRNIQLLKDPMREIEDSPTESDIEQV